MDDILAMLDMKLPENHRDKSVPRRFLTILVKVREGYQNLCHNTALRPRLTPRPCGTRFHRNSMLIILVFSTYNSYACPDERKRIIEVPAVADPSWDLMRHLNSSTAFDWLTQPSSAAVLAGHPLTLGILPTMVSI